MYWVVDKILQDKKQKGGGQTAVNKLEKSSIIRTNTQEEAGNTKKCKKITATPNSTSQSKIFIDLCLTGWVMFGPADWAIVATSSAAAMVPSSFRSGAFFVDCILICGGLEFDGKLLVDCNSWKEHLNIWVSTRLDSTQDLKKRKVHYRSKFYISQLEALFG